VHRSYRVLFIGCALVVAILGGVGYSVVSRDTLPLTAYHLFDVPFSEQKWRDNKASIRSEYSDRMLMSCDIINSGRLCGKTTKEIWDLLGAPMSEVKLDSGFRIWYDLTENGIGSPFAADMEVTFGPSGMVERVRANINPP